MYNVNGRIYYLYKDRFSRTFASLCEKKSCLNEDKALGLQMATLSRISYSQTSQNRHYLASISRLEDNIILYFLFIYLIVLFSEYPFILHSLRMDSKRILPVAIPFISNDEVKTQKPQKQSLSTTCRTNRCLSLA